MTMDLFDPETSAWAGQMKKELETARDTKRVLLRWSLEELPQDERLRLEGEVRRAERLLYIGWGVRG